MKKWISKEVRHTDCCFCCVYKKQKIRCYEQRGHPVGAWVPDIPVIVRMCPHPHARTKLAHQCGRLRVLVSPACAQERHQRAVGWHRIQNTGHRTSTGVRHALQGEEESGRCMGFDWRQKEVPSEASSALTKQKVRWVSRPIDLCLGCLSVRHGPVLYKRGVRKSREMRLIRFPLFPAKTLARR